MSENRVELNEQELESIVGGAYVFSAYIGADGEEHLKCKVTGGYGTYQCSESAKRKIDSYLVSHSNADPQEVINYAVNSGLFWK